jgi:hypothetical protein
LLRQNLPAVRSPAEAEFPDEVSVRLLCHFPEDLASVQITRGRSPSFSEAL